MKTRISAIHREVACLGAFAMAAALVAAGPAAANAAKSDTSAWQQTVASLPVPAQGCFSVSFPATQWQSTKCSDTHAKTPQQFAGLKPVEENAKTATQQVGGCSDNSCDYAAQTTAPMTGAQGSFPSVTCAASPCETGRFGGSGPILNNVYSLQLNTNFDLPATTSCSTAAVPGACSGWQQFVYDSDLREIQVEPALLDYSNSCTGTFNASDGAGNCYDENESSTTVPLLTPQQLASDSVKFLGQVGLVSGTMTDTVKLIVSGTAYAATSADSLVDLAGNWRIAQFGLYGDRGGTEANFIAGTDLSVNLVTHSGTTSAPQCIPFNSTGESNNLYLQPAPTLGTSPAPTMAFDQKSTSPTSPAACATAHGVGDTHLDTFRNLLYDFQAQGDFQLVNTGESQPVTSKSTATPAIFKNGVAGFSVQERQVSGAPSWPDAAVNHAVAAHVGTSNVAICTAPTRLRIDNRTVTLADGDQRILPDGASVSLDGNVYLIRDGEGDYLQATVQPGTTPHIDAVVGLGAWPQPVHGLLTNAGTSDNAVVSRGGVVLTAPFVFSQIYRPYGNSWAVPERQDLLSACNGRVGRPTTVDPKKPFYAPDLPPRIAKAAQAVCTAARVKSAALLSACTIDVAVLGPEAAKVYRTLHAPAVWGREQTGTRATPNVAGAH